MNPIMMQMLINGFRQSLTFTRMINNTNITVGSNINRVNSSLLQPVLPLLSLSYGFKVKYNVKRRCKDCFLVVKDNRMYNLCPTHPRHKTMSIKPPDSTYRILTWAGMSKVRPWR